MENEGISEGEWQVRIEDRLAKLESERGAVRSDGFVAPPQSDAPDTQDRPRCAERSGETDWVWLSLVFFLFCGILLGRLGETRLSGIFFLQRTTS